MSCTWPRCICKATGIKCGDFKEKKKGPTRIPYKSATRIQDDKEYSKILAELRAESDLCDLRVPGVCTRKMQGGHHLKKRDGSLYTDKRYIKRACNACNGWVEQNPEKAIAMGIAISKFKKDE